jgi:translation elongation factor EF-1alpha
MYFVPISIIALTKNVMMCGKCLPYYFLASFTDVQFLPISGLLGANMKTRMDKSTCKWWNGPCLFEIMDCIEVPLRDPKGPVRYDCTAYREI